MAEFKQDDPVIKLDLPRDDTVQQFKEIRVGANGSILKANADGVAINGSVGITTTVANVNTFNITIVGGLITSFTKLS